MVFAMRWCTCSSRTCFGCKFNESDVCGNIGCHKWSSRRACVYALHVDALVASPQTHAFVGT